MSGKDETAHGEVVIGNIFAVELVIFREFVLGQVHFGKTKNSFTSVTELEVNFSKLLTAFSVNGLGTAIN